MPGIEFMPLAPFAESTSWLTVVTIDPVAFGVDREVVRQHLESFDIESRPAWKPMHLQPLYADHPTVGGAVSARIFDLGLCLPSGGGMTDSDVERVADAVLASRGQRSRVCD